jgi:hypothetical protein
VSARNIDLPRGRFIRETIRPSGPRESRRRAKGGRKAHPDEPFQPLPVVLVDPDAGVEREAVEVGGPPGVPERIGKPDAPVHLGRLARREGALLVPGPAVLAFEELRPRHLPDDSVM